MATDKPGAEPEKPCYRPTDRELAPMRKCVDRADVQPAPQLKVTKNGGGTTIELDHPDKDMAMALLAEALSTTDLISSKVFSGESWTPSLRTGRLTRPS